MRELEARLMEERKKNGEIEDNVMVEDKEMRECEGCSIHQKHQIQVKQHCCIENSKMKEKSEGRNEWRRVRRRGKRDWRFVRFEKTPLPKSLSPFEAKLLEMGKDERQSQSSTPIQSINKQRSQNRPCA